MRLSMEELQMAVSYVAYMQMASYFDVIPVCENKNMESQLYMLYKLMPIKKQFFVEQACDKYIQKGLKNIPKEMLSMPADCVFKKIYTNTGEEEIKVVFSTWKYDLCIYGRFDARNHVSFETDIVEYEIPKISDDLEAHPANEKYIA